MTNEDRNLIHGYPPFRMKAADAAYYCGMPLTSFYSAVKHGEFPKGKKVVGGRYWLRSELEAAMANSEEDFDHDFSMKI